MKLAFLLALTVVFAGCSQKSGETASGTGDPGSTSSTSSSASTTGTSEPPATDQVKVSSLGGDAQERQPKDGDDVAVIDTNKGRIVFMFFSDVAPKTVANFEELAKKGFYDGTKFHRVIPGFMIQGGDPNSKDSDRSNDGAGGSGHNVDAEFSQVNHTRGIVSMAREGDPAEQTGAMPGPAAANSASSQFFIVVKDSAHLNGRYTAFGKVVSGMDVADKIVNLPRDERDNPLPANPAVVKSIKIEKWPVK